ncbi:MAG: pyridoxal phosphate-dependent aminotransferase [Muribaculaceae bacterium]|nr:pyridoxal phosphate-dependent aminotransferase [Muribaculaceae bacterium]
MDKTEYQPSARIQALSPSATLAMSQLSSELRAQGIDVINLSVGEPDFFTPDHIKQAAIQAVNDNFSFYTPVPGYLSLRKAICDKLQRENGLFFTPEQIVVGNGAKHALCNTVMAIVNPGDEVVIPMPAWVSYEQMVILAGGTPVPVETTLEQGFKLTPEQLEAAITPRTRLLMLCSPSNPTGSIYSRAELDALGAVLERHPQVLVIADEIYEHINYVGRHESIAAYAPLAHRVAIINGVSKAYAMTGWRIGYVAAPLWLAKAVNKLQGQYTSNASSIAQMAAEAAYNGPQECVEQMRQAFLRRRDLIVGLLHDIPGLEVRVPEGAFYVFPRVTALLGRTIPAGCEGAGTVIATATDLAMYLLREAHVATVSGDAFGSPGHLRLSYATSDDNLREAAARIKAALAKL